MAPAEPPLHALREKHVTEANATSQYTRCVLLRRHGNHPISTAMTLVHSNASTACRVLVENEVSIEIVSVVMPAPVMLSGENVQKVPAGKPEHAKKTSSENPLEGLTEIDVFTLLPGLADNDAGAADIVKSGAFKISTVTDA